MPEKVKAGDWVRIHLVFLDSRERAPGLPSDTAAHPYEGWINGWSTEDAEIGRVITIRTLSGRSVRGILVENNPGYTHSFGKPHAALLAVGPHLKQLMQNK